MDELFLHFLWKYQKFIKLPLLLDSGEEVVILNPGKHNHNSGPDFSEAKIIIGKIEWSGSVEIHFNASDWYHHKHEIDPAYQNVILHVVWKKDKNINYTSGVEIPTLILSDFVDPLLEQEYKSYINQPSTIRCEPFLPKIPPIQQTAMLDYALADRLEAKSKSVLEILLETKNDWDQTVYKLLGRNFGFSINKESFERLTSLLPYKVLAKHLNHPEQVLALVFGVAGFLEEPIDEYQINLKNEFEFLRKKYKITTTLTRFQWKFSKLRPANFPTVRLAQFAYLLTSKKRLFSFFIDQPDIKGLESTLDIKPTKYWEVHYDFGKKLERGSNRFGAFSIENVIINTVVPLLAAYSKSIGEEKYIEHAVDLLTQLKSEKNNITKQWDALGFKNDSAFDSQALIQQYNQFCLKKRCLHCNIGIAILHR